MVMAVENWWEHWAPRRRAVCRCVSEGALPAETACCEAGDVRTVRGGCSRADRPAGSSAAAMCLQQQTPRRI